MRARGLLLPVLFVATFGVAASRISGPDLRIPRRPGRPLSQEFDVQVINVGAYPGTARASVDVLDSVGERIASLEPDSAYRSVLLPPADLGGREGTVIRMKAGIWHRALLDSLARSGRRFTIRATVSSDESDANGLDNTRSSEFGLPVKLIPGDSFTVPFDFDAGVARADARWRFEHVASDSGWFILGVPDTSRSLGQGRHARNGAITLTSRSRLPSGSYVAGKLALVDPRTGRVIGQRAWQRVHDTESPSVASARVILLRTGEVAIQAGAGDQHSGLSAASPLVAEYSLDGGRHYERASALNRVGELDTSARFEFLLGPFEAGARLRVRLRARDGVGNDWVGFPPDASTYEAPTGAEALVRRERSTREPELSLIFDIERIQEVLGLGVRAGEAAVLPRSMPTGAAGLEAVNDADRAIQHTRRRGDNMALLERLRQILGVAAGFSQLQAVGERLEAGAPGQWAYLDLRVRR